jgi:hypothetical protein
MLRMHYRSVLLARGINLQCVEINIPIPEYGSYFISIRKQFFQGEIRNLKLEILLLQLQQQITIHFHLHQKQ